MKTIYLARHAQTYSNTGEKISINEHIDITELGHTQSQALADWFLDNVPIIDQIFVSNYQRTHQTAQPLLDKLTTTPVILKDLHEFNYLNFANIKDKNIDEIINIANHYWQTATPNDIDGKTLSVPKNWQAESFANFVNRVKSALAYFQALPSGTYVAFTHGVWLSMLRWLILNEPINDNTAMQNFRQFELAIRPNNCDVFCLTLTDNLTDIKKVRSAEKLQ